ncbi:unnamed protein product [Urochloa decumbens]|uniref:Uncharacterized protein n=1 Tax=Urochloa decumbens TaxID=240449 RepID=A0ABC8VKC1_9POAL
MEVVFVSEILKTLGTKLALVIKELSSIAAVDKDLVELQNRVEEINIWLQTIDDHAMRNNQSANWLKRLKDAAYDTEDLVHEFHTEAEKHDSKVVFECKTAHKIKAIKKTFDAIVKERSQYSANSMPVVHPFLHINKTTGEAPLWTNVDEKSIFGRDQVKSQIISKLIDTKDQQSVNIVSVIGLGGSGKTTLAKLVFNDCNIIKEHFEAILWVHVSREFCVEKIVEKLFEAIADEKPDHLPLQRVSRTISNKLAGKRFLLVLDDVWTEDRIHWEQFMVHLKSGAPGSSILLTTRSRQVAEAVDSAYTFDLPFLSEVDSWKVFQESLGMSIKGLDPEFLQVGIEIVKKCGGLPLAIKVLAGVLRGMKGINEWQSIRESNLLDVEDDQHRVSACLLLSYYHLPHHLKHCFTHCSIFPRGCVINRHHLINQWIAHGFVNPTNEVQQPEDVGLAYFDSLLKVGFLQDAKEYQSSNGEVTTCKMHDLVHDLTRQILQDEFSSRIGATDQIKRCRYLSLISCTGEVDSKLFDNVRALYISRSNIAFDRTANSRYCVRTIILDSIHATSLSLFISKFELLGYLEISNINCEELPEAISHCWNLHAIHVIGCQRFATLPESIGKLKKLRTLELVNAPQVKTLPQSIDGCDNLQSLYLHDCRLKDIPDSVANIEKLRVLSIVFCIGFRKPIPGCCPLQHLPQCITMLSHMEYIDLTNCCLLEELPEGIRNLKMLKVLNLQGCQKLCGLPAGCGQLTRLQKLGLFVVGDKTEYARISELENLDKLTGKLQIKNISCVKDPDDAEKVHLKKKNGMRKLSLDWYPREKDGASVKVSPEEVSLLDIEKDLGLLNFLEPPSEIEKLRISGYRGLQLPHWITRKSDSFDMFDIHILKQRNLPRFPLLSKLVLENLPNLVHLWGLTYLPGIKILKLRVMPKLVEFRTTTTGFAKGEDEDEVQYCFPHLSTLVISECPNLNVKPYFPLSLRELTLEGSIEQLLSSGSFFDPRHAHCNVSSPFFCVVDEKPPHITQLKLGGLVGSSSGWELLQYLNGLRELEISKCNDLRHLPDSMRSLTCLQKLDINWCDNLVLPEWLGELQSLQILNIIGLPLMSSLPQSIQNLTSLQDLYIYYCHALHRVPEQLGELSSLRRLQLCNLPGLTSLPDGLQRLTSLTFLNLCNCATFERLPESLGELPALQTLWIQACPALTSLPCCIKRLAALEKLRISSCPDLVRRCKEKVGEDWHLVSHIPYLKLS